MSDNWRCWHIICIKTYYQYYYGVVFMTLNDINVLVGRADWAWAEAINRIFAPRGINSMVAADATGALDIIERRTVHTAIVDMDAEKIGGLGIIRIIRGHYPDLPCILLSKTAERKLLSSALELNVFSVIAKPVDMQILRDQLNRLFVKNYDSTIFGRPL